MPDYGDAANRHWEDAGFLMDDNRLANADQLFGLAAECAMKAVMLGLGMPMRPDGVPAAKRHRVHINDLWDEFHSFVGMRNGSRYAALLSSPANPFNGWDISQRYEHRSAITDALVKRHKESAKTAMEVLSEALIDGVIS